MYLVEIFPHYGDVIMGVSNHQPHDCLLNLLFRRRSKKTSKLRVTGLCAWNSPGTGEFLAQMASNAENVSIWWRHHVAKDKDAIIGIISTTVADVQPKQGAKVSTALVLTWGPFYQYGLTLIPACVSNYIHHKVWDEITYPFPNFNGCTVEV